MKSLAEALRVDRRLVILRLLSEQLGHRLNSSNLHLWVHRLAIPASRDDIATDSHWLHDQGLVRLEDVPEVTGMYLVTLTARGADVVNGNARAPGVSSPSPK